jgi:hypothetical protein
MSLKGTYTDRGYSLIIGDYRNDPNNGVLIDNLQVTFDINKSSSNKAKTNSCTIDVYNLDDDTLALLDREFIAAEFSAGYYNTEIKRLFAGEVALVTTRKQGTDIVTQIRMGAAFSALNYAILNKLVPPGATHKEALEILVAQTKGINRAVITGQNCLKTLPNGLPLTGTPKQALDKLCDDNGMEHTIDGDALYVMDKGQSYTSNLEQAILVSPETGLYDLAYKVSGEGIKKKPDPAKQEGIEFTAALNADYKAGCLIKLEQDNSLNGFYKIESVRFSGSWRGGPWEAQCRCSKRIAQ